MKKHPIDDLFARKLSNWEPTVSPDLWNRIEKKQENSARKGGWWYWYAAAGVVLVMMTGYLVWLGQRSMVTTTNETIAKVDNTKIPTEENKAVTSTDTNESLAVIEKVEAQESAKSEVVSPGNTTLKISEETFVTALEMPDIKPLQKEEFSPEPSGITQENILVIKPAEVGIALNEEPVTEQTKNRVLVAHIPLDDEAVQGNPKSSKFIKVLRQLKNVKEGESVDWEEVGFNPKKLIARADERLKNEEEKVSKYYQNLKEKTKL